MTLWGFFWFNFAFFLLIKRKQSSTVHTAKKAGDYFILALFSLGTLLIIIPEFFYIKDIYPAHFRANTMFKLGYQAFIMMSIASTFVFFYFKQSKNSALKTMYIIGFGVVFFLVALYPHRAVTSYYGTLKNVPQLDGTGWIKTTYADYIDIITYLNHNVSGQPTILEAQGDSYTDFNVVSAYTGLPTVAGWWVHEWLWRGDSKVVGSLIPSIQSMYEGEDIKETKRLLEMYQVAYIIIGPNERKKYPQLKQKKLEELSNTVIQTPEGSLLLKVN